jgi:16S rRNA (guanine527-N7)-methyltransferase
VTSSEKGLAPERIASAVEKAGLEDLQPGVAAKFSAYYELLERWNTKLNLTAIRDPEEALQRHFVECIFCAQNLPLEIETLLDYGSGAGFPGIPIAICRPEIRVTLAESQGKKASFLREVVRTLGLAAVVHGGRVEQIAPDVGFDAVALRAVDNMEDALVGAAERVKPNGWLAVLTVSGSVSLPDMFLCSEIPVPGSENGVLLLAKR